MQPANNEARESLVHVLSGKASQKDVEMLKTHKTNKQDTDMQMKSIDIMHRQVTHMSVLIIEILRQGIVTKTESETTKQQRQKFLLQQGCSVARWIAEFDPQNVNSDNLILPTELKALYDYSNTLVKALPDFLNQTVDHRIKHAKQKSPRQSSIVIPSLSTSMANVTHMKETWNIDHRNYAGSLLSPRKLHLNMSIDSGLPSLS